MQQFCQDLSTKGWQQAMGNMAGVSEREVTQAFHLMGGDDATLKIAEHVFKQSRCEVLSAQGARVRVKASGADIMTVLERVMNDPAVQRYLGQRQTAKADADLERTVLQSMQRQYQSGRLPLYTQTLNVDLERLDGHWTLTEDSLEALVDVLGGGPSRLEE
ncbi:hypothetical protein GCM10017783_00490 [Deinococcus piscis]|uniref:Uncharacterized protein n=2 Tax=Deinococcus piscis TaxID=394230 RepID=A0ABQ3K2R9_9DEIO|nr:hypothetical protein GCM10017783_00490 [Deinococcus piscis]